jgi:hypothetical protein
MRYALIGLAVLVGAVGLFVLWGFFLPATTEIRRQADLAAPLDRVFTLVTDVAGQSAWRSDVGSVAMAPDGRVWVETAPDGSTISFQQTALEPGRLFAIAYQSSRGFEGVWEGRFEALPNDGVRLSLMERVTIQSPITRALGRLFAPPGAHADLYLKDLTAALAKPATQ